MINFYFLSWILTFKFDLILGFSLSILGPNGLLFWIGVVFKNCFGIYYCSWTTFIFYALSILMFDFDLISGSFFNFLSPIGLIFGVGVWFKYCFGFYSASWTTFIFFVSFNSDILFSLHVGVFFFLGVLMGYIWSWGRALQQFWGLLMYLNNFHFLCFSQFWYLILNWFWLNLWANIYLRK